MAFQNNVFVNCPFDSQFLPLLRPLLFTIIYLGMTPRIALERSDSGESRLNKIIELIQASQYSIHDLSRSEASSVGELYRLNMPFELGLDFGCRFFGKGKMAQKKTLVLDTKPHRYKAALSDLSGHDIEYHNDEPYRIFRVVRHWLKNVCLSKAPGPGHIEAAFTQFMTDNYETLTAQGFTTEDIATIPVDQLIHSMNAWVGKNSRAI